MHIDKLTTDVTEEDVAQVLEHAAELVEKGGLPEDLCRISIAVTEDGELEVGYYRECDVPIDRIRRITGYLVGTLDRWNDAKKAEERDRVKHGMQQKT